jgi:hypothetical protein
MYCPYMNDATETLSIKALTFIAEREDLLDNFVLTSGTALQDLYETADQPETWAAILDYVLSADEILIDFCEFSKYHVQDVWRARGYLPGAPASDMVFV